MKIFSNSKRKNIFISFLFLLFISSTLFSQGRTKWLGVGSLHNWYSEFGAEIEHGLFASQQYGLRWPASHPYQDMQAAKAFWIGVKNFKDADQFGGNTFLHKVVHVGPRVSGANEFFPVKFEMYGKFEPPKVYVDGEESFQLSQAVDKINVDQPYDKMIYNEINTMVGATVKRKIYQFSQEYHDNYIIHEVTIVNTGNVDDDSEIELPNTTLEDVYLYYHYRLAISRNTRYVIGNATGWGINTMLDVRGDGLDGQYGTDDEDLRANYAWHGYYPAKEVDYDNIGGPIWEPNTSGGLLTETDTVGRLGSAQFCGVITLHADQGVGNNSDDISQPSTTGYVGSDAPFTSQNDPFNPVKMGEEYGLMEKGHQERHAYVVKSDGNFAEQQDNPALSSPGGFSNVNGYGPYTLAPGDSIRIVWAEGASGLSWNNCVSIGRDYKNGTIDAVTKNEFVMTGRDSLFETFRRAIENYNSGQGFTIPQNPLPPSAFYVDGKGDRIELSWEYDETIGPAISGFGLYRAREKVDSTYYLIQTASPSERTFYDTSAIRGVSYFYYIQAIGLASDNNGGGLTPSGVPLRSGRFYSQSYTTTQLKRQAAEKVSEFRVVPNPYIRGVASELTFGVDELNKIAFYNITGDCKIQVYSEMGELIWEVEHNDGSGDEFWFQTTSSNQLVVSGVYIAVVTDNETGEKSIQKFAIIK
ncbi:MAG: hypothetical protein ABFS12_10855 [Bacteroidota bacterium]